MRATRATPLGELPLEHRGLGPPREQLAKALHANKKSRKRNDKGERDFGYECRRHRLPTFVPKFKLLKRVQEPRADGKNIPRRWEFDWCAPDYKLIVEIDGGIFRPGGGAHSHPVDVRRNMIKRNDAAFGGFAVLAFTPEEVKSGHAIAEVQRFLAQCGWTRDASTAE